MCQAPASSRIGAVDRQTADIRQAIRWLLERRDELATT
jgi:hypothetical protein